MINAGDGTFSGSTSFPGGSSDSTAGSFCDVDLDGDLDIIVGNWAQANELLLGDGAGGYTVSDTFKDSSSATTYAVDCADVNGAASCSPRLRHTWSTALLPQPAVYPFRSR